jgi:CheY-like chemotaxis protein
VVVIAGRPLRVGFPTTISAGRRPVVRGSAQLSYRLAATGNPCQQQTGTADHAGALHARVNVPGSGNARRWRARHAEVVLKCIIVDDSAGFLAAARRLLQRQGITVAGVASTSAEALRLVEEQRPDVVLVDIGLGAESGFDLARRLHSETDVPPSTILISTRSEQDYRDLVAASPVVGFLSKTALSARAIVDLLDGAATAPPGT